MAQRRNYYANTDDATLLFVALCYLLTIYDTADPYYNTITKLAQCVLYYLYGQGITKEHINALLTHIVDHING